MAISSTFVNDPNASDHEVRTALAAADAALAEVEDWPWGDFSAHGRGADRSVFLHHLANRILAAIVESREPEIVPPRMSSGEAVLPREAAVGLYLDLTYRNGDPPADLLRALG